MRALFEPRSGFARRLAGLYAATFVVFGVQLPFFPVWLRAKGLDAQIIGAVLAIPMFVRVFAILAAAGAADRYDRLRGAIILTGCASFAAYVLVGFSDGAPAIIAAYILASLAFALVLPLIDTYALRGLSAHGKAYGPVRLWGSVAFIGGSFAAGFISDVLPARDLIWLIVAAMLVGALASFSLAPLPPGAAPSSTPARPRKALLRDPAFIAVLGAAGLIQASHAVYYGFSTLEWRADGLGGSAIAGLWALGVIAEIVLFAMSARLPPALTPTVLIMIGAGGAVLRWTAMALDPPVLLLPLLQLLHALSFGATYLGALNFAASSAPPGQSASAQGYLAITAGAAMAGAMGLSGVLYAAFGGLAYVAMASMAVAGGACAFVAYQLGRRLAPL
jgi:MFS transporter, PPP family, 3-phenylpropionic acid transporter